MNDCAEKPPKISGTTSAAIARAFLSLTLEPQCSADNASKEQPQSMRTTSLATLRVKHSQNERANE